MYTGTNEVFASTTKTFVIEHPLERDKYLVHGCLEGPEAGVYYCGTGTISSTSTDNYTEISLPSYVTKLAYDFTSYVSPIYNGNLDRVVSCSEIENGKFTVYGDPGDFTWMVMGTRQNIQVEVNKDEVQVRGNGPYKFIH